MGAELDPAKAPRRGRVLTHMQTSIADVHYWYSTGDWPLGKIRHQSPKVKVILRMITSALLEATRKQSIRHDMIIRALGSKGI